jgi:hypothetical protein
VEAEVVRVEFVCGIGGSSGGAGGGSDETNSSRYL